MSNLKPYMTYKPSGIAWLGDIPEHWEKWKISRGAKKIGSGTTPSSGNKDYYENGTINWLNTGDFNDGFLYKCKKKVTQKAIQENSALKIFPTGTLSIAMYGATIGKVCIIQFDATTNQACCNIEEGNIFSNIFLMYWFIGHKPHIVNLSYGGGQPNISQDVIKSLFVPCPVKSEQTAIANFLDYKTAKIDRFIFKKKQLIKLLNEQKAGIINDAVTKGLNPNTKTKPSGIEWLGDIPEHWEVRKLKYVAKVKTGRTPKIENSKVDFFENGDINWFTPGDFNEDGNLKISKRLVIQKAFDDKQIDLFPKNTIYLVSIGGTIGKVGISENVGSSNQQINALIFNNLINPKFGYFLLKISKKQIDMLADFTTLPILNQTKTKEIIISFPDLSEQAAIVSHIEAETAIINKTIATIEKEIALVQEYRTAIIAEAVTGKIDVRGYEFSTIEEETYEELEEELDIAAEEDAEFINQGAE